MQVSADDMTEPVREVAGMLVRLGQLVEERRIFSFPSRLHEVFFMRQHFCTAIGDSEALRASGIASFIAMVVERMSPAQLSKSFSRDRKGNVYERHWQNEFYR